MSIQNSYPKAGRRAPSLAKESQYFLIMSMIEEQIDDEIEELRAESDFPIHEAIIAFEDVALIVKSLVNAAIIDRRRDHMELFADAQSAACKIALAPLPNRCRYGKRGGTTNLWRIGAVKRLPPYLRLGLL